MCRKDPRQWEKAFQTLLLGDWCCLGVQTMLYSSYFPNHGTVFVKAASIWSVCYRESGLMRTLLERLPTQGSGLMTDSPASQGWLPRDCCPLDLTKDSQAGVTANLNTASFRCTWAPGPQAYY